MPRGPDPAPRSVLVTGAAGYVGSTLVRTLLDDGLAVIGLDDLRFGGESLLGVFGHPRFRLVRGDLRDAAVRARALQECDAVVHLAAIVGDAACSAEPEAAVAVNRDAAIALHGEAVASPRIHRFVFASTCSNYGCLRPGDVACEDSPLAPVSLYAETKVAVERYLRAATDRTGPATSILRFATVYGVSPRMRFDLTVNDFVRDVVSGRELVVFGEHFWRPYCHVADVARACAQTLSAEPSRVHRRVIGVGDSDENYQKRRIAEEIAAQIPGTRVRYVRREEDPRNYRVDFSRIRELLGFRVTRRLPDGIREVRELLESGLLTEPFSRRYSNT